MENRFKIVRYGRWLYTILDKNTNLLVKKPKYAESKYGYVNGEATFITFKTSKDAQYYIDTNLSMQTIEETLQDKEDLNLDKLDAIYKHHEEYSTEEEAKNIAEKCDGCKDYRIVKGCSCWHYFYNED